MKSAKILLSITIFVFFIKEGLEIYKVNRNIFGLLFFLAIINSLCFLIIRSALKGKKCIYRSSKAQVNFWSAIKGICIISFIGFFFNGILRSELKHVIKIIDTKIQLDKCMEEYSHLIKDIGERKQYCTCMAEIIDSEYYEQIDDNAGRNNGKIRLNKLG